MGRSSSSTTGTAATSFSYVVHGEEASSNALPDRIDRELGWTAVVPRPGEAGSTERRHEAVARGSFSAVPGCE
ncbi:hypothetical protein [Streptomyces sp. NPDC102437]|uniref:hypothetical protein n=1 Tax=Streptomyces sp. NPDC102437 TaxID=3366175 RepID=UPI003826459E